MDVLKAASNIFLRPLATLDNWVGSYVPRSVAQIIVNSTLAQLGTAAIRATGRWKFTMISDRITYRLTGAFLFIALKLTNSARQKIGAAPHQRSTPPRTPSNQPILPVQTEKFRELYLLLINPSISSYYYIMDMKFSWGDLLATAKRIQEETIMTTLSQVFNRLDFHGNSLPWAILNSRELEPDERYLIMKGLLENEADLSLDIERGFGELFNSHEIWKTNVNGSTTLFKLIQDGLLKDGALGTIKKLWNGKENNRFILDFLKEIKKDFDTTIFDAETGELK